jgi:acetylserotonin O-methyltransferase
MSSDSLPDVNPILHLIEAFRCSKVMFVAVSLGVFDCLENGSSDVHRLATELECQSDGLERLLDACVGLALLKKNQGVYSNEAVANAYLCRTSPRTLVGYILYSDEVLFRLWAHLEDAIRHGGPQWSKVFHPDGNIFDQFFRTDESMRTFLKGMHGIGVLSSSLVVSAFDLSSYRVFVDVGGATGHLAMAACERYPGLRAIVFDLPRVIHAVRSDVSSSSVASRIELVEGDFFLYDQIPHGDIFGLGRILHDWPDEKALRLLNALYHRLPRGGGILIAEKLLNADKTGPTSAHVQSLNMLVCTEGKERNLEEYRLLLETAGFRDVRGYVTGTTLDAIFAVKV